MKNEKNETREADWVWDCEKSIRRRCWCNQFGFCTLWKLHKETEFASIHRWVWYDTIFCWLWAEEQTGVKAVGEDFGF